MGPRRPAAPSPLEVALLAVDQSPRFVELTRERGVPFPFRNSLQALAQDLGARHAELGVDRIGHFRLFRETVGARFWPRLLEWIDS